MLDSIPVPLQAIVWPLVGTAITLTLGRLLPNWLRRVVALAVALSSFAALWSLRGGDVEAVAFFWEPLHFFRTNPILHPDGLSLLMGLTATGVVAASALGIRGSEPQRSAWHGLLLVALAGGLIMAMAANLPTLALGSALLDLALITMAVQALGASDQNDGPTMGVIVTGALSTLLLFFAGLQMSAQTGTTMLAARDLPTGVLVMVGVAGILRLMVFPLHPQRLSTPENIATIILPMGAGIYLLARTQVIAPILIDEEWMLTLGGVALLVGGLLTWAGSRSQTGLSSEDRGNAPSQEGLEPEPVPSPQLEHPAAASEIRENSSEALAGSRGSPESQPESSLRQWLRAWARSSRPTIWPGIVAHQAGFALTFAILLDSSIPWPWIGLALALGMMAVWWDSNLAEKGRVWPSWFEWTAEQTNPWRARIRSSIVRRIPALERWQESWLVGLGTALLPTMALASLIGAPLTVGARGRWPLYAALLDRGEATLLLAILAGDTLFAAGLWTALGTIWTQDREHRLKPGALLSMTMLALVAIVLGIAPGSLMGSLGLDAAAPLEVSVWGLGLILVIPWLLGAWLARVGGRIRKYLDAAGEVVNLDWLYRAAGWAGKRLAGAVYWLGQVGEGEAWWGWALIVLILGAIFLSSR